MKTSISPTGDVYIYEENGKSNFYSISENLLIPDKIALHKFSLIDDWRTIRGENHTALLKRAQEVMHFEDCIIDLESCFTGKLPDELILEILIDIEDTLKFYSVDDFLSRLLVAPLNKTTILNDLINTSQVNALLNLAVLLDRLLDHQKHLNIFIRIWLKIISKYKKENLLIFSDIWQGLSENNCIPAIITARKSTLFQGAWLKYLNNVEISNRSFITKFMKELCEEIFPTGQNIKYDYDLIDDENSKFANYKNNDALSTNIIKQRVLKQVHSISMYVKNGEDNKAEKYLDQLIHQQLSEGSGSEHVIKSLCNISQNCSQLFRTDFEYKCLEKANRISPQDSWTIVQLAKFFIRSGNFSKSIELLEKVIQKKERNETYMVALTELADVYMHQKNFEGALILYKSNSVMFNSSSAESVEIALASLHRRKGDLELSLKYYNDAQIKYGSSDKIISGIAEIDKLKGNLTKAREAYLMLIAQIKDKNEKSYYQFSLALANIYKRENNFQKAYQIYNDLIELKPFSRELIYLKSTAEILLKNTTILVESWDASIEPKAYGEWKATFIVGLNLLRLKKFEKARELLFLKFKNELNDEYSELSRRLATIIFYLHQNNRLDLDKAEHELNLVTETNDIHYEYLWTVLKYHVAKAKKDEQKIQEILTNIKKMPTLPINALIENINQENWALTRELEIFELLKIVS